MTHIFLIVALRMFFISQQCKCRGSPVRLAWHIHFSWWHSECSSYHNTASVEETKFFQSLTPFLLLLPSLLSHIFSNPSVILLSFLSLYPTNAVLHLSQLTCRVQQSLHYKIQITPHSLSQSWTAICKVKNILKVHSIYFSLFTLQTIGKQILYSKTILIQIYSTELYMSNFYDMQHAILVWEYNMATNLVNLYLQCSLYQKDKAVTFLYRTYLQKHFH